MRDLAGRVCREPAELWDERSSLALGGGLGSGILPVMLPPPASRPRSLSPLASRRGT